MIENDTHIWMFAFVVILFIITLVIGDQND